MSESARSYWNSQAATFDSEPDHGLLDPAVRKAWRELLLEYLPTAPAEVVDIGCGTGSLSVLLAKAGYRVRGLDLSDAMVEAATENARASDATATFQQGDASHPPYEPASCDVVLERHVLWAVPDPDSALAKWVRLLRAGGRLVLVEGSWSTGAGLTAAECKALVLRHRRSATVRRLESPDLWGRPVDDERYLLVSPH